MVKQVATKAALLASAVTMITGCNKSASSYSLLDDGSSYKQQAVYIPKKIDILWVIDNSGSMATSQTNLTTNFQSFINRFETLNFDFHMSVVTTDAWERQFNSNANNLYKTKLRDGKHGNTQEHSGVFVMNNQTPNLADVFRINATQGINGNGDERALESFRQALLLPDNNMFRRDDAFLAIIIVSDEEDFSHTGAGINENYDNSGLYSVQRYVDFLADYTGAGNFSVSTISVNDDACKSQLSTDGFSRKIATRLADIAGKTSGVVGSLCSNFGTTLQLISDSIIQLTAVFKLGREPVVETIAVTVDGVAIAQDPVNGWTYDASNYSITFHGTSVPGNDSNITIDFFPKSIKL